LVEQVMQTGSLAAALADWRAAIGPEHVLTDEATLREAGTATFATTQSVPAVIRPADRVQVQECVRVANKHKIPIYPISTGKNWGYGSRVPVRDGSVVIDLGRLNKIVDYDEKLAYITVEPGVTFRQVYEFLVEKRSRLRLNATGSTAQSSLIGNAVERGLGSGLYADRFAHSCDMEVVLPTGEYIQTGFGRFPNAMSARVGRWGVGPYLDGLFTQSNLGIVTRMTFWLMPPAEFMRICFFAIDRHDRLPDLLDALQELKMKGICQDAMRLYNDYKVLSGTIQFPWGAAGEQRYISPQLMEPIRQSLGIGAWFGELYVSAATEKQGLLECELLQAALSGKVDRIYFNDWPEQQPELSGEEDAPHNSKQNGNGALPPQLRTLISPGGLRSVYWRKQFLPDTLDPDRDGCGVLWCAPLVPFDGQQIDWVVRCIERVVLAHEYEPVISLVCVTERSVVANSVILYDRDTPGEDERAMACYEELLATLLEAGYVPYRLGIQSMQSLPAPVGDYASFAQGLKMALDPNGILSPGRYI
jgi:4-cresol dehydrogenase (hydroxylating)